MAQFPLTPMEKDGQEALVRLDQIAKFQDEGWKIVEKQDEPAKEEEGEPAKKEESKDEPFKEGDLVAWLDGNNKPQQGLFEAISDDPSIALVLKEGNKNSSKVALAKLKHA